MGMAYDQLAVFFYIFLPEKTKQTTRNLVPKYSLAKHTYRFSVFFGERKRKHMLIYVYIYIHISQFTHIQFPQSTNPKFPTDWWANHQRKAFSVRPHIASVAWVVRTKPT